MPPSINRVIDANGLEVMRVTKSDGTTVDIDFYDYITFGTNDVGRVLGFSMYGEPDAFSYRTGAGDGAFGPPLTNEQLDALVNRGKIRPHLGGRRKTHRRRRIVRRKQNRKYKHSRRA
jgi:hypothetical protein